jgi:hypothetical protein
VFPVLHAILVLILHLHQIVLALLQAQEEVVNHAIPALIHLQDQIVLALLQVQEALVQEVVLYAVIRQACQLALVQALIQEEDARIMVSLKILG